MKRVMCGLLVCVAAQHACAARGEMGTGIPGKVGMYSQATGVTTYVWSLSFTSIPFPSGCSFVRLTPGTMGMDAYKIAVSTILLAKATNRSIRFYAHAERDGGCGVDYVQFTE